MLLRSEMSRFDRRLTKSVRTMVADELMLVATVLMPAEKSEAMTSPVTPVGNPWTIK